MAKRPVPVLKSFFNTGDKPTEGEFADVMDSFRHKDEPVTIAEVQGLVQQLSQYPTLNEVQSLVSTRQNHTFSVGVPILSIVANKLVLYIVLRSFEVQTVSLKAVYSSYDEILITDLVLEANKPMVLSVQLYSFSNFSILMTGHTGNVEGVQFLL
jgi:hypothetical protein